MRQIASELKYAFSEFAENSFERVFLGLQRNHQNDKYEPASRIMQPGWPSGLTSKHDPEAQALSEYFNGSLWPLWASGVRIPLPAPTRKVVPDSNQ
jgi:hypothetical protein